MSAMFFVPSKDVYFGECFPAKNAAYGVGEKAIPTVKNISDMVDEKILSTLIDGVKFSIVEIMDGGIKMHSMVSAIFPKSPDIIGKTEENIRESLVDNYSTFPLFQKSLEVASEKMQKGEKISVDLYITDLRNPDFLPTLEKLRKKAKPDLLTIEIRAEDSGILDSVAIDGLKDISELGFGFALNDFTIENGEIVVKNLQKIVDAKLSPEYIKIPESTLSAMKHNTARISHQVPQLFSDVLDKGIRMILFKGDEATSEVAEEKKDILSLPFFQESVVATEDILGIGGGIYGKEGLIRFGDGFSVPQGLEVLKMYGLTRELMKKMLLASVSDVLTGKKRSINVYLKDLADAEFIQSVKALFPLIQEDMRRGLIFEILEDKYGVINNKVLKNIRFLQNEGFTIAIDDLYIGDSDVDSLSEDNLSILLEEGIIPDYIKIDGRHIEGIRNGTITQTEIDHLREVIGQFTVSKKKVTFIMEWITDTEHALKVLSLLGVKGANILFQGRSIGFGSFGASSVR